MDFVLWGNSIERWSAALLAGAVTMTVLYALRYYMLCRLRKLAGRTESRLDDLVVAVLASTHAFAILAVSVYIGAQFLAVRAHPALILTRIAITALLLQAAVWGDVGLRAWRDRYRNGAPGDGGRRASSAVLCFVLRLALWVVAFLMVLDNLGFNITTLVASLGIGGVAVALAVQNILGDLFASLSIMLDKPFELGDFIIVGDVLGWVEHIGLKTTRVRGLGGEEVVFSNGDLLKSRIHNHKRLERRRVAFTVRVAYGTPEEKLRAVPAIIRDIVGAHPVDFEHCHFMSYGEWSLNYEVVYVFRSPDWFAHLDTQQEIFLALYRRFEQEHIQFAHPMSIVRVFDRQPGDIGARAGPAPVAPVSDRAMRH
ncbi:mechanosensitive ion channel family protein [Massilia solisilvae]|uniref:Mechanosensitive ion channel family protein n=1 Tax=Massilia solisilvae TaxID=1811225 RepID=A0ABT2BHM8_9BURK|nr:mechanosensitive ion channel family protein [Massilia solisilvae]MCS0608019.1 mechanosensitive ion channel family protein [Massilia solisilvae]